MAWCEYSPYFVPYATLGPFGLLESLAARSEVTSGRLLAKNARGRLGRDPFLGGQERQAQGVRLSVWRNHT